MDVLLSLLFFLSQNSFGHGSLFKSIVIEGSIWPQFIYETVSFPKNKIECASACSSRTSSAGCNLFHFGQDTCHIGITTNQNTEFLPVQDGDQAVMLDLDFMRQSLDGNFQKLASVTDESGWEKFITTKKTTSPKGDVLDCSTECEVFQASCDIFVFHNTTCYVGTTSHSAGSFDETVLVADLYIKPAQLQALPGSNLVDVDDVVPAHWTRYIRKTMNGIQDLNLCEGVCIIEGCQYVVYESASNTCHLGELDDSIVSILDSSLNVTIRLYHSKMTESRQAKYPSAVFGKKTQYERFVYKGVTGSASVNHCFVMCFFDVEDKCDFFFRYGTNCYMASFGEASSSVAVPSNYWQTLYIAKGDMIKDEILNLFPSTLYNVPKSAWNRHHVYTYNGVIYEKECQAKAYLFYSRTIEFYIYQDEVCYLGDLSYQGGGATDLTTPYNLTFIQSFSETYMNSEFNVQVDVVGQYWNPYIFKTIQMTSGKSDFVQCGALCLFSHPETCDMFAVVESNCHLGDMKFSGTSVVQDTTETKFYISGSLGDTHFWAANSANNWSKWVYKKISTALNYHHCLLLCRHDDEVCDFAVFHQRCYLGRFNYAGSAVVNSGAYTTVYMNLDTNPADVLTLFEDKVGNIENDKGIVQSDYWPSYIYENHDMSALSSPETMCARLCIIHKYSGKCHFYYFADNTCMLGHYGHTGTTMEDSVGEVEAQTKYYQRTDISFTTLMSSGTANCESCTSCAGSGYMLLDDQGETIPISSNNYPQNYGINEKCYWRIYAPGSNGIQINFYDFHTFDGADYLAVSVGIKGGPEVTRLSTTLTITSYTYKSEFVYLQWVTNDDQKGSRGFTGFARRMD